MNGRLWDSMGFYSTKGIPNVQWISSYPRITQWQFRVGCHYKVLKTARQFGGNFMEETVKFGMLIKLYAWVVRGDIKGPTFWPHSWHINLVPPGTLHECIMIATLSHASLLWSVHWMKISLSIDCNSVCLHTHHAALLLQLTWKIATFEMLVRSSKSYCKLPRKKQEFRIWHSWCLWNRARSPGVWISVVDPKFHESDIVSDLEWTQIISSSAIWNGT